MFRNKYVYTCPDVIHDHKVAKRNGLITLAVYVVFYGGLYAYGRRVEKQMDAELKKLTEETPVE